MTEVPVQKPVSIVMATYNGERFIAQQLDSLLAQTYPLLEIIICDDGSTDHTRDILEQYATRHPQIKLFFNETNLGYIRNFEKAILLASAEYIALCDQDDYWVPEKIEKLSGAIGDYPMVYSDSMLCDEQLTPTGKKISDVTACQSFYSCLQQAVFCRVYGHATLIKKSMLTRAIPFPEVLPHDWWLSFIATLEGGIYFLPETLVHYRQHSNNIFGAVGGKRRKEDKARRHQKKQKELTDIRSRMNYFYEACPAELVTEKSVLLSLVNCYEDFSFIHNLQRVSIFLRYQKQFLAVKKRAVIRKWLFCFKMFVKIK